jgi:hypothetical protein
MDTGEGRMQPLESIDPEYTEKMRKMYPKSKGIFSIGEELEIKGSKFIVKSISPFGIKLKLVKQP